MNTEEVIETIRQLNPIIEVKYKARVKGIFGSYTRGEEQRGSDLDVLVEFQEGANLLDLVGISNFLEDELNIPVGVVPVDALRQEIKDQVMEEAVSI